MLKIPILASAAVAILLLGCSKQNLSQNGDTAAMSAHKLSILPNGHYVQREQDVRLSSVPSTVRSAVKQKFPGYRPGRQAESLQLVDGTMEYSVDLNKPHDNKEAIFSESGDVLCQGPQ